MAPLENRFIVALADALVSTMNESDWKRFATLHGLSHEIENHPRFLRSLQWGDPDYEGHVLSLVQNLFESEDREAFDALIKLSSVQSWFKRHQKELLAQWTAANEDDPILEGISGSLEEVHEIADAIDLGSYTARIRDALPRDPALAVGATKDLLEAVMRTALKKRSVDDIDNLDFPALTTKCFHEIGLSSTTPPADATERLMRKTVSRIQQTIETINELRNEAGTGHGKPAGTKTTITLDDANMIGSIGMILSAWLMRKADLE
ncbi:abortive infection family protein [Bradyrhizobium sp. SYSU BS000235]|uniref:abortive infection family protein n=1 Tax=Bradyrhizobium sp. SYSU BS000235 TaxID=3411332 RepID=UPI003C73684A